MPEFVTVRHKHTSNVHAIIKGMSRTQRNAIDSILLQAVQLAKARCPYLTGRLMRSIRILTFATDQARGVIGRMGSLMPYANKINLQQRESTGRGFMDTARASMVDLKPQLKKEWAKTIAQKRLNRSTN